YLLGQIEKQLVGKPAREGHVPDAEKSSKVPPSVGFWVGVARQGKTLYGKCYLLPGHFAEDMRVRKVVGGTQSNSLYAPDSTFGRNDDGTVNCVDMTLESLDFVPPERAALKLGGEFVLSSEMTVGDEDMAGEQHTDAAADLALLKKAIASIKPED